MESPLVDHAQALETVRRHIRILVEIGRIAGVANDLNWFLDQVVVQVARAVEINHVKVLQYRPKESDFLVAAGIGWREGVVRTATLAANMRSAPGRAYRTGEPVIVKDFNQQSEYVLSEFLKQHGIISLSNVPVVIDGAAWGVLEVDSTVPRDFGEDTTEFLKATGALIGAFLQRYQARAADAETERTRNEVQSREVLLREMQHRVKNNFQLILSSISIQKRQCSGEEAKRALRHVTSRISAISLAHDQLTLRQSGQKVRLSDYIRALCTSISQQADGIDIEVEADELELAIERAVPVGLILNEAITNSIKYAFGPEGGAIHVKLVGGIGYGEGQLRISDSGKGMDDSARSGSGLKLISSLAKQIGGTVAVTSTNKGTTILLTFPIIG